MNLILHIVPAADSIVYTSIFICFHAVISGTGRNGEGKGGRRRVGRERVKEGKDEEEKGEGRGWGPGDQLEGLGERCKLPQRVRAELVHQTACGAFWAKKSTSGGSNFEEFSVEQIANLLDKSIFWHKPKH